MDDYRVNLDIFAGPLDLLLYLVRKDEVDIYDIPISHITEQYVHYVDLLKILDIDLVGDFLVMAATLMEIKSAMLLPRAEVTGEEESESIDPRSELIRQLLEYKKFKDAANLLHSSLDEQQERIGRPGSIIEALEPEKEPEIDIDQLGIWDLLEAFDTIMRATGSLSKISHITDDTSIDLYQIDILNRLQTEGAIKFEQIFEGQPKLALVGLFLALLELIRSRLVWAEQAKQFETIFLRSLTDEPAEQAVQKAIINVSEEDMEQPNQENKASPEPFSSNEEGP